MPSLEDVPEPDAQLPEELRYRVRLAWEAQCDEGFAWGRLPPLNVLDVPGLRFIATLGDLPVNAYTSAWRLDALFPLGLAIPAAAVVWDPDRGRPLWQVLLASVPIVGLFGLSVLLLLAQKRMRSSKVGVARAGLYLTRDLLLMWHVNVGKSDDLVLVERQSVRRIFSTTSGSSMGGGTVWVEYRMKGEERTRDTGLPGLGSDAKQWLAHWVSTGALPVPADEAS
ncbi:MAG: hypothetical protein AAGA56_02660 [Myxococcota bacterium]